MHTHVCSYAKKTHLWLTSFLYLEWYLKINVHLVLGTIVFMLKPVFLSVCLSLFKGFNVPFFCS